MRTNLVIWTIGALTLTVFIAATVLDPASDGSAILWGAVVLMFVSVGAVLWVRVSANPIGPMFLAAGVLLAAAVAVGAYGDLGAAQVPPLPGADGARLIGDILFFYPIVIAAIGIPLVFPDGRLPSSRFRVVAFLAVVDLVAWTIGVAIGPGFTDPIVFLSTIIGFAGAAVAVAARWRRGDSVERQQVKWLAADAGLAAFLFPLAFAMPDPEEAAIPALALTVWVLAIGTLIALPLAIGIAVMRYRLYEIDRIVSRTIAYGLVLGVLAATFGTIVVVLSTVLAQVGQGRTIAVAASTLVVYALFQPILTRAKRRVDRRFNRASYDAQRTIDAFSTQVRDEVDLPTLRDALVGTAAGAVDPLRSEVWLRPQPERR